MKLTSYVHYCVKKLPMSITFALGVVAKWSKVLITVHWPLMV